MKKIRVLHIIKSLGRGGAETLLPETLKLHNLEQFEFHYIYFLPWKDALVSDIKKQGGIVTCISSNNNITLLVKWRKVANYVRTNQIDIIHSHLPWAGILSRLVGKVTGIPVLYTEHNKQERYHWITRRLNLATINLQTKTIAVSDDVASSIRKNKTRLSTQLLVIKNGVNTEYFRRDYGDGESSLGLKIPSEAIVIGTVAVFRSQKRLDVWLDVAATLLREFPNAWFIVVGDGPLQGEIIKKRQLLGLEERLLLPGLKEDVRPYMGLIDIFMMSSQFEGLPLALLEAMSMECAVACTAAGGVKEVIVHGINGSLVPVEDPMQLVDAVRSIVSNGNQRELGSKARRTILEHYSVTRMVRELENQYLSTLKLLTN